MKPLVTTFTKLGYQYKQIWRDDRFAIYEQSSDGRIVAYEVIRVRIRAGRYIKNDYLPEYEEYPSSSQWGKNAYSVYTLDEAYTKIESWKKEEPVCIP